jgi:hypothetical protein
LIPVIAGTAETGSDNGKQVQYDTIKAGDTLKTFHYVDAEVKSISYCITQLDTNIVFPDSIVAFCKMIVAGITSPIQPVDFQETSSPDSNFRVLKFTYNIGSYGLTGGEIRSGWIWKPGMNYVQFLLKNLKYLAGRKLLIWVKFNT